MREYLKCILFVIWAYSNMVLSELDIFEFSSDISLNYTLFTSSVRFQELKIERKNSSNKKVTLEYKLIEYRLYPVYSTKYIEFSQNETVKNLNISFNIFNSSEEKRLFSVKISSTNYRNRSQVFILVINDLKIIEFFDKSFYVYNKNSTKIVVPLKIQNTSLIDQFKIFYITVPLNEENFEPAVPFRDYWPSNGYVFSSSKPQIEFQILKNILSPIYNRRMFRIYLLRIENCDECGIGSLNAINIFITWSKPSFDEMVISNIKSENYLTNSNISKSLCFSNRLNQTELLLIGQLIEIDENKVNFSLNDSKVFLNEIGNEQCMNFTYNQKYQNYCFNLKFKLMIATFLVKNFNIQSYDNFTILFSNKNCTKLKFDLDNIKINDGKSEKIILNKSIEIKTSFINDTARVVIPILNFEQKVRVRIELDHFMEKYFNLNTNNFSKTYRIGSKTLLSILEYNPIKEVHFVLKEFKFFSFHLKIEILENNFESYTIDADQKVTEFIFEILNFTKPNCNVGLNHNLTRFGVENNERKLIVNFLDTNLEQCNQSLNLELSKIVLNDNNILNYINPIFFNHILTKNSYIKILNFSNILKINSNERFLLRFLTTDNIKKVDDYYFILNASRDVSNGPLDIQTYFIDDISLYLNFIRLGIFGKAILSYSLYLTHPLIEYTNRINVTSDNQFLNQESNLSIGINLEYADKNGNFYGDLYLEGNTCYEKILCENPQNVMLENSGIVGFTSNYVEARSNIIEFGIERKFGCSRKVKIFYTLVSNESLTDLYFRDYRSSIELDVFEFIKFDNLTLNQVFSLSKKIFYLYITNVISDSGEAKISNIKNRIDILILPSPKSEFNEIVYFSTNHLKMSLLNYKMDLNIQVYRLNCSSNTEVTVKVKTTNINGFIPGYIMALNNESIFNLAESGIDYEPVDLKLEFKTNEISRTLNLSVFPNFDNFTKYIFIYLFEPTNGAKLIEPDEKFSPYLKIELTDEIIVRLLDTNNQTFNLKNGRFLIELNQSKSLDYFVKYQVKLRIISLDGNIQSVLNCSDLCDLILDCNTLVKCNYTLDFISQASKNLTLKINIVEINKTMPSSLIISYSNESFYLEIYSLINQQAIVYMHPNYILNINNRLQLNTSIELKRNGNLIEELKVSYSTQETDEWLFSPNIRIYKSRPEIDFYFENKSVIFRPNQTELKIEVLLKNSIENEKYPIMFKLVLERCEPNCSVHKEFYFSNVTIVNDNFNYWDFYKQKLSNNLNYNKMLIEVSDLKSLSGTQHDLLVKILHNVTSENSSVLLKIFCHLLSARDPIGKIEFLNLLESFLIEKSESIVLGKEYFPITCHQMTLNYNCLSSQNSLIIKFLGQSYQFLNRNNSLNKICFLEFDDTNFLGPKKNYLLFSKALLVKDSNSNKQSEVNFNLTFKKNIQTAKKCAIYDQNFNNWNFSYCSTFKFIDRIECKCNHKSIYGLVSEQQNTYYGFNHIWIFISLSFVIFSCFLTLLSYQTCIKIPIFISNLIMHFIISLFFTHLLYLITIAISSSIIGDEPYDDNSKCMVLSIFFHIFILSQFSCMFSISLSIYKVLAKGTKKTSRFRLYIRLNAWIWPVIIIAIFYLITTLVYEFAYNYSALYIYGDIFENKELCFIKSVWSFFAGCIIPCIILFLISIGLLLKVLRGDIAQDNGDIYLNRSNFEEILTLIGLNFLVFFVNLFGSLHIRNGNFWLFVLFCVFDFFLGFYIVGFYVFKRHIFEYFRAKDEEQMSSVKKETQKRDLQVVTELDTGNDDNTKELLNMPKL